MKQQGEEALLAFTILPPWYKTWWAYLFSLLMGVGIVLGIINFRTRQLVQRSTELEKTIAQRTEELHVQAEELETIDTIVRAMNREDKKEKIILILIREGMKMISKAEKGIFLEWDHVSDDFSIVGAVGYDEQIYEGLRFTKEEVFKRYSDNTEQIEKDVYIIHNISDGLGNSQSKAVPLPKSILAMAVTRDSQLEGFLVLDNFSEENAFDRSDLRKLRRLREHAISAILKARSLKELQVKNLQLDEKNKEILATQTQLITQEKLASLGSMTAGIAHEIQNPLNFVNNFADLSMELAEELQTEVTKQSGESKQEPSNGIRHLAELLYQNSKRVADHGKRASAIVKSMLLHTRTDTGEKQSVALNSLIDEFVNLAYHGMRANTKDFVLTIERNYDPAVDRMTVSPQELSRVIVNLVNNACYATHSKRLMHPEQYSPTLSIQTRKKNNSVELRVRDNGTGIPAELRKQIFAPFFTTKPSGLGTGLGLSISYEIIVQLHKGTMEVQSVEGEFTEFLITLPESS